jgi:hypothetical protein
MNPQVQMDPMFFDFKVIAGIWTFVTIIFSLGIAYGAVRYALKSHDSAIAEVKTIVKANRTELTSKLSAQEEFVRGVLFRSDGLINYLTRDECDRCRAQCQANLDGRLSSMQHIIELGEKRREEAKDQWAGEFKNIAGQMGQLIGQLTELRNK